MKKWRMLRKYVKIQMRLMMLCIDVLICRCLEISRRYFPSLYPECLWIFIPFYEKTANITFKGGIKILRNEPRIHRPSARQRMKKTFVFWSKKSSLLIIAYLPSLIVRNHSFREESFYLKLRNPNSASWTTFSPLFIMTTKLLLN